MPQNNIGTIVTAQSPTPADIVGLVRGRDNIEDFTNIQNILNDVSTGMGLTDESRGYAIRFLENAKGGLPAGDRQIPLIDMLIGRLNVNAPISATDVAEIQDIASQLNPTINDVQTGEVSLRLPTEDSMPGLIPESAMGTIANSAIQKERKSMTSAIESLSNLSDFLDESKLEKYADKVDVISSHTLNIKTAQYVGIQGYWLRNDRCWKNCYRQKRSKNPDMPAQEVWNECHDEYLASINNDKSGWEKYTGSNDGIKVASGQPNQDILDQEKKYFNDRIKQKIKEGWTVGSAVFDTVKFSQNRYVTAMIENATKLADLANKLDSAGYQTLSKYAIKTSEEMTKEAQFGAAKMFDPKTWGRGLKEQVKQWTGGADPRTMRQRLMRVLTKVQALRTRFPQDLSTIQDPNLAYQAQEAFLRMREDIGNENMVLEQMSRQDVDAGRIYQKVSPVFQQFAQLADKPKSRRIALDNLANTIGSVIGQNVNQDYQTQIPAAAQTTPELAETQVEAPAQSPSISAPEEEAYIPAGPEGTVEGPEGREFPDEPEIPSTPRQKTPADQILGMASNFSLNEINSLISSLSFIRRGKQQEEQQVQATSSNPIKQLIKKITRNS